MNLSAARSILCVPGHRPDLLDKARKSGADLVMMDFEDGCVGRPEILPGADIYRVPYPFSAAYIPDGAVLMRPKSLTVEDGVIPTAEDLHFLRTVGDYSGFPAIAFGRLDLEAQFAIYPRALLDRIATDVTMIAARAGCPCWDGPSISLDPLHIRTHAARSIEQGFTGIACIHPGQVQVINEAFNAKREVSRGWAESLPEDLDVNGGVVRQGDQLWGPPAARRRDLILGAPW